MRRYDCRKQSWGHTCRIDNDTGENGSVFCCHGHLHPPVSDGDEVVVEFGRGSMVLRFFDVKNERDPRDMYFAKVKTIGYLADIGEASVTDEVSESAKIQLEGRTPESHPEQYWRKP